MRAPATVPLSVSGQKVGTLGVSVILTDAPLMEPVNCPVPVLVGPVAVQVPERLVPDCAMVIWAGPLPGTAASLMVPIHVPATCVTDGAAGEPPPPQDASAHVNPSATIPLMVLRIAVQPTFR